MLLLFLPPSSASNSDSMQLGTAKIVIRYDGKFPAATKNLVKQWVADSAKAVSKYYGKFPVELCTVLIHATADDGIGVASAEFQNGKVVVDVPLGVNTGASTFREDWILTHELVHLAFPLVWDKDRWLVEGMATYIEPLARMQIGKLSAKSVWSDMYFRCPAGLARNASETLSQSRRIDRLYWGGATFCLLLDMELRKQSKNKYGLQRALSIITNSGVNFNSDMEPRDALAIADKALRIGTLVEFYDRYSNSSARPDLQKVFADLGVLPLNKEVRFDDKAPLAKVRLLINRGEQD